jgi:hypothetical protein
LVQVKRVTRHLLNKHMEEQEDAEAVEKVKRVRSKGVCVP